MKNPARTALTNAVNRAIAEGSPVYVNQPAAMTITEQLDAKYAEGKFACIVSREVIIPVRNRDMIRECKNGVEVQRGKKWVFAFAYQVKFATNA